MKRSRRTIGYHFTRTWVRASDVCATHTHTDIVKKLIYFAKARSIYATTIVFAKYIFSIIIGTCAINFNVFAHTKYDRSYPQRKKKKSFHFKWLHWIQSDETYTKHRWMHIVCLCIVYIHSTQYSSTHDTRGQQILVEIVNTLARLHINIIISSRRTNPIMRALANTTRQ